MKEVKDNFSGSAAIYAAYRPQSPQSVYDFILSHCRHGNAWDCGTGNGQVAARLADSFDHVYGTDISAEQLSHATQRENITYLQERAERTTLPANSIDLVTAAQAIHWFDFDNFYTEVRRVCRPGALVAAWTYSLLRLTQPVNDVIDHLYKDITHPYWDKERDHVDAGYATIPFPFERIAIPEFTITQHWTVEQLTGYLRTWSGVIHYRKQTGIDPVATIAADLQRAWGTTPLLEVTWPVHMLAGHVTSPNPS